MALFLNRLLVRAGIAIVAILSLPELCLSFEPDSISVFVPIDSLSLTGEIPDTLASERGEIAHATKRFHIPKVTYRPELKELIIPVGLISIGAVASRTERYRDLIPGARTDSKDRETPFDDIAQLVPAPSLFLFDLLAKEKHHPVDQFFLMGFSYGLTVLPIRMLKDNIDAERPYGGNHSFPSGHTATAFVGAYMIYKEFKDSSPWIAGAGLAMGTTVAVARVVNDKHWVCDVLAGAGIAMLATEIAYLIYFPIRNLITDSLNGLFGEKEVALAPTFYSGKPGIYLAVRF